MFYAASFIVPSHTKVCCKSCGFERNKLDDRQIKVIKIDFYLFYLTSVKLICIIKVRMSRFDVSLKIAFNARNYLTVVKY